MNANIIARHFARIGARAQIHPASAGAARGVTIDVGRDRDGEFFDLAVSARSLMGVRVLDAQPRLRHLLLMSEQADGKHKFLCGHDERHWFVAAVPERAAASNVKTAFEALKPGAVHFREQELRVKPRKRNRRRNEAFVRQGEWFFVGLPDWVRIDERVILKNEPISRGGKPHICEELVRQGGELVYVSVRYPQGLRWTEYQRLISRRTELRHLNWVTQRRNPTVFVRGRVRHPDHKTIVLDDWRQVVLNTESQSAAMAHVAFID